MFNYEYSSCGNQSYADYMCCELCGCDEWIKHESTQGDREDIQSLIYNIKNQIKNMKNNKYKY